MKNQKKSLFPENFFNISRKEAKTNKEDFNPPFKWSKSVLSGKSKIKIVKNKNPKVWYFRVLFLIIDD